MRRLIIFMLVLFTVNVSAVEDNFAFDEPAQRQLFLQLTEELRCPMCQNQNIADSDAMIAHDMRRKVYSLLQQGKSEAEIIEYMKDRYGDFVYYKPPVTPATVWLWALPLLFIFTVAIVVLKRKKSVTESDAEDKLAKADAMLKQDDA